MKVSQVFNIPGRGVIVALDPEPSEPPAPNDMLEAGGVHFRISRVEALHGATGLRGPWGLVLGANPNPPPKVGVEARIIRLGFPAAKPVAALTLEEIAEGRKILEAGPNYQTWQDGADFFRDHGAKLLDAAERVARDDYHARAHREAVWAGEAPERSALPEVLAATSVYQAQRNARKLAAELRAVELGSVAWEVFRCRPLVANDQHTTNPHAVRPREIVAWYRNKGLEVRAELNGSNVQITPLRAFDPPTGATIIGCVECQGTWPENAAWLESHKPDCSRLPL